MTVQSRSLLRRSALGIAVIGVLGLTLNACAGPRLLSNVDALSGGGSGVSAVASGVTYGNHAQKLDVYAPKGTPTNARLPVVLFIHGGSWRDGDRGGYAFAGKAFAREGFVSVVIDYRKVPEVRFPDFMVDAAEAVAWTESNIAAYGGDPTKIIIAGHSAGAHIAVLLTLDPTYLRSAGVADGAIKGAIGLAGPYDFYPFTSEAAVAAFAGADPALTQPITYARGDAPPLLLLHGDADDVVLPRNSTALAAKVTEAGGQVVVKPYAGVGHVGIVQALSPIWNGKAPVLTDAANFVRATVP